MTRSLIGLAILVADIWAIIQVLQSNASAVEKFLWTLIILVLPFIGLVVWYFAGPGKKK
jgi:hypothetical protein